MRLSELKKAIKEFFRNSVKESVFDDKGLERAALALPQTEEEPIEEPISESLSNPKAKTGEKLADMVLGWYDFYAQYIDDGGQYKRAVNSNKNVVEWFNEHPSDIKKKAYKILLSKSSSSLHNTIKYLFGSELNESSKEDIIKDLDKAKNDLLKKVDVLIAKKKKLYSDVDIESPMSADEKKLDKDIADLFSDINKLVLQKRSLKESELKGYLAADVVDDIAKVLGSKMVKGYIENAPNRNYIYLKLTDIKFGNDVVKMLKSKFGIESKIDKTFGNIPTVSFPSNKVIKEVQAVSGGKVHKLITGKNLKFKGKSYNQIDFETLGVDNNNGTIRLRIISPKEIFGNEMSLDFRTVRRGPFFKTDTNNQLSEGLYYVGYNKGRGMGRGVFKDSYSSYKDAKKEVEKLEKQRGGSYYQIAYYVSDKDGNFVRESVNEAAEPQIITQLRDVVKSGYKTLKDPKSGKNMKVDSYSASAIIQVYDALSSQNKEKFSNMGLLGMQSTAFKLIK